MRSLLDTPTRRTIRRKQLREIVPLADSTIYEMEQRGEFQRRFALVNRHAKRTLFGGDRHPIGARTPTGGDPRSRDRAVDQQRPRSCAGSPATTPAAT